MAVTERREAARVVTALAAVWRGRRGWIGGSKSSGGKGGGRLGAAVRAGDRTFEPDLPNIAPS